MRKSGRLREVWDQWHHFNRTFFGGKLSPPRVIRITSAQKYQGYISYLPEKLDTPVAIFLSTHQSRHSMTGTLLHEMVHQYQREVLRQHFLEHDALFRCFAAYIERRTGFVVRTNRLD